MIEIKGLTKKYGSKTAVDNISFTIRPGSIYGLLGPNGAGKSTTMNMIAGCLAPTDGTVTVNGYDILDNPIEAKKQIGYLPEIPPLYNDMTPYEYLRFVAEAKGVKPEQIEKQVRAAMDDTDLEPIAYRICRNLSKGYRQRVGIAQALLGNPDTIILDEPTVGLDPKQIIEIRELIKRLGKKKTVVLSSHILSEISSVCDRVIIISRGKVVFDDEIEAIGNITDNKPILDMEIKGDKDAIASVLDSTAGIASYEFAEETKDGNFKVTVNVDGNGDPREDLFFAFAAQRCVVISSEMREISLEEVFLKLTESTYGGKHK